MKNANDLALEGYSISDLVKIVNDYEQLKSISDGQEELIAELKLEVVKLEIENTKLETKCYDLENKCNDKEDEIVELNAMLNGEYDVNND